MRDAMNGLGGSVSAFFFFSFSSTERAPRRVDLSASAGMHASGKDGERFQAGQSLTAGQAPADGSPQPLLDTMVGQGEKTYKRP